MSETDDLLARRLLGKVLDHDEPWTVDMRLRVATVAQAYASLSIVEELRRLNEGRDQWYREVLEVLTQAKDGDESSLRSEQPAAASDGQESDEPRACRVCGKPGVWIICTEEENGQLNREQWWKHHERLYYDSQEYGANKTNADSWATSQMEGTFGPRPEES